MPYTPSGLLELTCMGGTTWAIGSRVDGGWTTRQQRREAVLVVAVNTQKFMQNEDYYTGPRSNKTVIVVLSELVVRVAYSILFAAVPRMYANETPLILQQTTLGASKTFS